MNIRRVVGIRDLPDSKSETIYIKNTYRVGKYALASGKMKWVP